MSSTVPLTVECASARLIDTNNAIIVHPTEIYFSVAHQTCPFYALGLPCYCVNTVVAQSINPSVPIMHVAPSSSTPTPAAPSAQTATNHRRSDTCTKEEDLTQLEKSIISSPWHAANALEPICGSPNCPYHADRYGIRGLSCYTAFVDTKPDGTFGCWYERCSRYSVRRLEDAVKHQRTNHFNHRPFVCVPANGTAW